MPPWQPNIFFSSFSRGVNYFFAAISCRSDGSCACTYSPSVYNNARFRLINTYLAVIFADLSLALPFLFLLFVLTFLGIPNDLRDAAKIDGASELRIFGMLCFPSKPVIVTTALLEFCGVGMTLLLRLVFLTKDSMRTLSVGLLFFQKGAHTPHDIGEASAAAALILAGPVIVLFLIFQRQFIQGLTQGAFK